MPVTFLRMSSHSVGAWRLKDITYAVNVFKAMVLVLLLLLLLQLLLLLLLQLLPLHIIRLSVLLDESWRAAGSPAPVWTQNCGIGLSWACTSKHFAFINFRPEGCCSDAPPRLILQASAELRVLFLLQPHIRNKGPV